MLKHISLSGKSYCRAGNSSSQWNLSKLKSPLRKLCQSIVSQSEWPDGSLVHPFLGASRDFWALTALAAKGAAHSGAWHWKVVLVGNFLISISCCPIDDSSTLAIHGSLGFLCHPCPHIPGPPTLDQSRDCSAEGPQHPLERKPSSPHALQEATTSMALGGHPT